jgi:putative transposase
MTETVETCRRLYNYLLADRIGNRRGAFEQKRHLTVYRKENKYLTQVHSQVLQDVVFRLDKAYGAFFTGFRRHPKFKRKDRYNSFRYPQVGGFKLVEGRLRLSKIGLVRAKFHRPIEGMMKTCTIIRDIDQWYACISAETESAKVDPQTGMPVGIDLGVLNLATLSNGRVFENQRHLDNSVTKIITLQRRLSRKLKTGRRRSAKRFMAIVKRTSRRAYFSPDCRASTASSRRPAVA